MIYKQQRSVLARSIVQSALVMSALAVVSASAVAQTVAPASDPAASASDEPTLETVTITAERREADIQKTAIAVTAISGDTIGNSGQTDINQILQSVPSVQVTQTGQIAIRGIGTDGVNKAPSTAVYEDGIMVATGLDGYYFDLARVEVLAGPQGTLYGGTATGGAVNVITNSPKLDKFEALVQGELGNYDLRHATAVVNIPLADSFAIRLAGNWQQRNSYASSNLHGVNQTNLRGKALWDVNDRLTVLFGAEYFHNTSLGDGERNINYATGEPLDGPVAPVGSIDNTVQKYYLNAKADLGFGDLTYIPGIQIRKIDTLTLGGFLGMQGDTPDGRYLTQELRLSSKAGSAITWVGGLYYYNETYQTTTNSGAGTLPFIPFSTVVDNVDNHQSAVFGQATYPLTATLRFTGGGRYSDDVVHHPQSNNGVMTAFEGRYHSFDYLARLEQDLGDHSLLYASLSTGYRPGGIAQAPNAYGNEKIKAYEIGNKNTLFGGSLILDGDVFYYDYGGFQTGLTVPCAAPGAGPANCFVFDVASIPAKFKGAELTATWAPTRADVLSLSPTYIDSRYAGAASVPEYLGGPITQLATDGHVVTHTARWAANASYQHTMTLSNGASLFGRAEANYQGDSYTNFDPCIFAQAACSGMGGSAPSAVDWLQKGYTLFNVSTGYSATDKSWEISAYMRNIGGHVYKLSFGPAQAVVGAPRTYGLTASKRW